MKEVRVKTKNVLAVKEEILSKRTQVIELNMFECGKPTIMVASDLGDFTRYVFDDESLHVLAVESLERALSEGNEFKAILDDEICGVWVRPSDSRWFNAELINKGTMRCIVVTYAGRTIGITHYDASKKQVKVLKEVLKHRPDLVDKVAKQLEVANKLNLEIGNIIESLK